MTVQLTRLAALQAIAAAYPRDPMVVTLGATARELAGTARSDNHLYILDSMGLPPAIGLGLSLGLADTSFDKCLDFEGDGSLLMGFSTPATIGVLPHRPRPDPPARAHRPPERQSSLSAGGPGHAGRHVPPISGSAPVDGAAYA